MSEKSAAFARQVENVVGQFEAALDRDVWTIRRDAKRMRDEFRQVYSAPALTLFKGATRLLLDPNGYDVAGAEGAIDLYLLPPFDAVATLFLEGGTWFIHSPFPDHPDAVENPDEWERSPLDAETIRRILESIARDAIPSV